MLKNKEVPTAPSINKLPHCFLINGEWFLSKLISDLCNLSISLESFPDSRKIVKINTFFRKWSQNDHSKYIPISLLPLILKTIKKLFIITATYHYTTYNILSWYYPSLPFQAGFEFERQSTFAKIWRSKMWQRRYAQCMQKAGGGLGQ